jgi:hypothetical protein
MVKAKTKRFPIMWAIDAAVFAVALGLVIFGIWNMQSKQAGTPCATPGQEHTLIVKDDVFSKQQLTLKQCDVIKIANLDALRSYEFAFGVHDKHVAYPGFTQQVVRPNEFIVIDAVQTGGFRLHDHLRDKAAVEFTIEPK